MAISGVGGREMRSPFPGMNPYLESAEFWSSLHSRMIVAIADAIAPALRPKYYVEVEKRVYFNRPDGAGTENSVLVGVPDVSVFSRSEGDRQQQETVLITTLPSPATPVEVTIPMPEEVQERYLEIREVATGMVITTIELLSPKNKRRSDGQSAYLRKRQQILSGLSHLVEIDLLREGTPMPILDCAWVTDYRILISRGDQRPQASLYAFNVRDPIPAFQLPLQAGDEEPMVQLKEILEGVYERAGYDLRLDYLQEPQPSLSEEDTEWMDALFKEAGIR